MHQRAQHIFRRDTHNLIAMSLSLLCIIAITPFAIYRTYVQSWPIAFIDWSIVLSQAVCLYISHQNPSARVPGMIVAMLFAISSLASLYTAGVAQLYWLYPATVSAYFLTDHIRGSVISSATVIVAATISLIPNLETKQTATVLFTLFATNIFGYIFAFISTQRDQELSRVARIDSLTGVLNRRALNETLQRLSANSFHPSTAYYLAIIDLDNFKAINDKYGHLAGDAVLNQASAALAATVDRPENLYRYGGDEFIYIINDLNVTTAERLFDELQQNLTAISDDNSEIAFTLSVGIAQQRPNEATSDWLHRADQALLAAKRNGKNQFKISA